MYIWEFEKNAGIIGRNTGIIGKTFFQHRRGRSTTFIGISVRLLDVMLEQCLGWSSIALEQCLVVS